MARDEARLGAKEYGLSSYENAYEFKVYDDQKASWVEAKSLCRRELYLVP